MAHPLEAKIDQVRRQALRLRVLYALGWSLAWLVGIVLVLCLADYSIRFQDPGLRVIATLVVLGVLGWTIVRYWRPLPGSSPSDVQLARHVERRFPLLADRLASTIEFLRQGEIDVQAGSIALRRAVIHQTSAAAEPLDFSQIFERRPTQRALVAGGLTLLAALAFIIAAPSNTRIALARLLRPLGDDAWPRYYSVQFRNAPTRLAVGQPFEVELLSDSQHVLPDEARIFYRYDSAEGAAPLESEPMQLLNGTLVARKDAVARPFWYRAEGGDDQSMPWIHLQVVEPPRLTDLQVTLHPPEYAGLPVETSERNIVALLGTRVALKGTATKKLRAAAAHCESGTKIALGIAQGGYGFELAADAAEPLVVGKSGPYWIELTDAEGLVGGADDRWDIRAIADQVPTVTIEQPAGNIFVTARGEVPLRIAVKDDLAIRDVALHHARSDRTDVEDFAQPLFAGSERVAPRDAPGLLLSSQLGESQLIEHRWQLEPLQLAPGTQLTLWATAGDYLPQSGKSTVRRINVITPAELEERLAQRQTLIFGELQRVLKLQQDARSQTRALEIQLQKVGRLQKPDVDQAQSAELNQRQVKRTLTSPSEGIPAQIADFLDDLRNNRVDSPDLEQHMTSIGRELERLDQQHLGEVERELTSLIKAAQSQSADAQAGAADAQQRDALAKAAENQDQVVGSLERMVSELSQWDNYRRFAREIAQLHQAQDEIARATKELGEKTLGRELKDLDAQQQANLKKLAAQQADLSRRLDKTQQQMSQMSESLKASDPLASATIADGLHQAQQQGISSQMRESSRQLEQNRLGQAGQQQAQIGKQLDELLATLSNRREQQLSRLVEQLREGERELEKLLAEQRGLRMRMEDIAKSDLPDAERKQQLERLVREQQQLAEKAGRLSRRLERLQAEKAGRSTAGAAGKMEQAQASGSQGDGSAAQEQAEHAEKDLEEAQKQLAERRRQAEADLAEEQLARLEDALKSLHERQQKLLAETQRIENLRAAEGRLTRAQLSTVNELSRQQQGLEAETSDMAARLALAEVVQLALAGAGRQMSQAADLLGHRETGSPTQGLQESARQRLAQLLTVLGKKQGPQPPQQQGPEGEGAGGGGSQGRQDGAQVLSQLKLLKLLQEDLNTRFRTLQAEPDKADARQLAELAAEQGKLADLTLKLAQPPEGAPEDDPENLPDIRQDVAPPEAAPESQLPPPDASPESLAPPPGTAAESLVPPPEDPAPAAQSPPAGLVPAKEQP